MDEWTSTVEKRDRVWHYPREKRHHNNMYFEVRSISIIYVQYMMFPNFRKNVLGVHRIVFRMYRPTDERYLWKILFMTFSANSYVLSLLSEWVKRYVSEFTRMEFWIASGGGNRTLFYAIGISRVQLTWRYLSFLVLKTTYWYWWTKRLKVWRRLSFVGAARRRKH